MAGYPTPLGGVSRQLNPSTFIHSTAFKRGSFLNFGNRTAIINIPNTNKLIVWSSIPVGPELEKVVELASKNLTGEAEVIAGILPDKEHTMAAIDLKKKYPNIFLIGPSGISDKPDLKLDYAFSDSEANQVVKGSSILKDLTNLDFVFLNGHANREVVTFDKNSSTLFEADLLFNIPWDGTANKEQYPDSNQNAGLSFLTRFLNPDSRVGRFLLKKLIPYNSLDNRKGISAIYNEFEFDSIVMSHGAVIEKNGKTEFKKVFGSYL